MREKEYQREVKETDRTESEENAIEQRAGVKQALSKSTLRKNRRTLNKRFFFCFCNRRDLGWADSNDAAYGIWV